MKRCRHNAKVTRRWRQTIRYIFTLIFRNLGIHFIHWPISKFCRQQIHPKQLPPPEVRLDKCASSFARCNSNFHWCRMQHPEVYLLYHLFYSEPDSGWVSRTGSHSELTNSIRVILLQRYRFFLSVPCLHEVFQFSLNFCIAVHLRLTVCDDSDFQPRSSMMERRIRSKAWLHFTKQDENSAVCNQCNAVISCQSANTSNVLTHLSTQHGPRIKYRRQSNWFI